MLVTVFISTGNAQSAGSLSGQITDSTGAAIPGATVTLSSSASATRTTVSNASGGFSLLGLPSGSYQVQVAVRGFQTSTTQGLAIATGRAAQLNLELALASASTTVAVSANAANGIDTTQSASTANIDRDRIEELPIPSRNYLNFVLLAPQVTAANPAIAQQTLSGGEGGFSFGGLRPSSNAVYIDGASDNDEFTGASRTELSPEAINDFQIVNHGFAAQSGGASGGSIDVQTRNGTDARHGDAFLFVQNGALNAVPPLEIVPRRPDESRLRAGMSQGGAIVPHRSFYYVAAEQEYARGEDANDLAPATLAGINQAIAHSGPLSSFQLQPGFFPTVNQQLELSGRLDQALSSRHALMLRYALTNTRAVNDAFHTDDLTDRSSRGSSFLSDNDLNATLTSTLSPRLLNAFTFQLSQRRAVNRTGTASATQPPAQPGVLIPGVALFGTPYDGNSRRFESHVEANDSLIRQLGPHTLTFGAGLSHIALRAAVRDGFNGLYLFTTLADLSTGNASFFLQAFPAQTNGNPDTNFAEVRTYAFAQDHWQATRTLSLDLGLRYDFNLLPSPLPQHALNLAPRLGLAWSPTSAWVVRAGFGLFYDRLQLATANRILEFNGSSALQQIVEGPAAAALYRTGSTPTRPLPGVAPSIYSSAAALANPYSEVASLGVERALPGQWTVKAEAQLVHGLHLGRTANTNLAPPTLLTSGNAAALGLPSPTPQQLGREVFSARLNPAFDATDQFSTTAGSSYRGATFTLNRQFTDDFQIMAGYTFSRTTDDASYDTEQPQNPYAPSADRGFSLQDQRHRLVLSGLWLLGPDPDDAVGPNPKAPSPLLRALYGFEFAPILTTSSGFRANPLTGQDSNAEHIYPFAARPLSAGGNGQTLARNSLQTAPQVNFDFRVLRLVPIGRGHLDIVAESFNLLNHPNPTLLNNAFGPGLSPQPGYSAPIANADARRIQFSLDFEY